MDARLAKILATNPLAKQYGMLPAADLSKRGRLVEVAPKGDLKIPLPRPADLSLRGRLVTAPPSVGERFGEGVNTAGRGFVRGALNVTGSTLRGLAADPLGGLAALEKVLPTAIARDMLYKQLGIPTGEGIAASVRPDNPQDTAAYKAGEAVTEFAQRPDLAPLPGWEQSWTDKIAGAFGSTAPFLAAGATGAGALPVTTMLGAWAGAGEAMDRAIAAGATKEQILEAARLGQIPGASESLPIEVMFNRIPLPAWGQAASAFGRVIAKAATEGGQEIAQTVAQNIISQWIYDPSQPIDEGMWEAGALGAIVGGGAGVVTEPFAGQPGQEAQPGVEPPQDAPEPVQPASPLEGEVLPPEPVVEPRVAPKGDLERPTIDLQATPRSAAAPTIPPVEAARASPAPGGMSNEALPSPVPQTETTPLAVPVGAPVDLSERGRLVRGDGSRRSPALLAAPQDIERAEAQTVEATPAQARAGNAKAGHARFRGLQITVQVPRGGTRKGITAEGVPWQAEDVQAIYGHLRGVKSSDGHPLDVFVGDNLDSDTVFVIDQITPDGKFDEAKAMLGFNSEPEARTAYESAFSDGRARERVGAISAVPFEQFKAWAKSGKSSRAFNRAAVAETRRRRSRIGVVGMNPELRMRRFPILSYFKETGGVDPKSALGAELRHMGVSEEFIRKHSQLRGLYQTSMSGGMFGSGVGRAGGRGDVDDFVASEWAHFFPGSVPVDANGYIPPDNVYEAIRDELFGAPRRSEEQQAEIEEFRRRSADSEFAREEIALDAALQELGLAEDEEVRAIARELMADGQDVDLAVEHAILRAEDAKGHADAEPTREETVIPFPDRRGRESSGAAVPQAGNPREQSDEEGELRGEPEALSSARKAEGQASLDLSKRGRLVEEPGAEGKPQTIIPGAERISDRELAQRRADQPLKPKAEQKPMETGLFGDSARQKEMFAPARRAQIDSPEFKAWFHQSKVVDENGDPLMVFHGALRSDRIVARGKFDRRRATSGPMAFFTEDPEIASSYSTSKADNSLEAPTSYAEWIKFRAPGGRSEVDIERAWYFLTAEQRAEIAQKLPHVVNYDAEGDEMGSGQYRLGEKDDWGLSGQDHWDWTIQRESRGNVLKAAVDIWLSSGSLFNSEAEFMDILRLGGMPMDRVRFDSPHAEFSGVLPVFLSIQNPLVTTNIPANVLDALERGSRRTRVVARDQGDIWHKASRDPRSWIDELKTAVAEGKNSHVWTSIPDWVTRTLRSLGYDGIQDTGGKMLGAKNHAVWIPFDETQVKSATGNRGTFSATDPRIAHRPSGGPKRVTREKIEREVIAIAKRMSAATGISLEDKITTTNRQALKASGYSERDGRTEVSGSYNFVTGLIRVSMTSDVDARSTAIHESWHSLESLLTPAEMKLLAREKPRLQEVAAKFLGYDSAADMAKEGASLATREINATAAEAYLYGKHVKGVHIAVRKIFDRIGRILREVRNYLRGLGFKTAEDVFDQAWGGAIKARGEAGRSGGEAFSTARRDPAPPFYSAVVKAVENAKLGKATPDQWLGYLRNQPKVKQEELDWLGVGDWLKGQASVTKEALLDFVRANQVEVREVEKRTGGDDTRRVERLGPGEWAIVEGEDSVLDVFESEADAGSALSEMIAGEAEPAGETKFGSYQLPGGENYRELLLTLPAKSSVWVEGAGGILRSGSIELRPAKRKPGYWDMYRGEIMLERRADLEGAKQAAARLGADTEVNFRSPHWDEPNVLAHVRFNEREANGKRVLFIEEVQSDWHQKGRKRGYRSGKAETFREPAADDLNSLRPVQDPDSAHGAWMIEDGRGDEYDSRTYSSRDFAIEEINRILAKKGNGVPDAPFKTTWPELAMKRMIRWAAESSYDEVAWTPGDVQAERYDLSKQVSEIAYWKDEDGNIGLSVAGVDGSAIIDAESYKPAALEGIVGKDIAERIINDEGDGAPEHSSFFDNKTGRLPTEVKVLQGEGLKVGGEGMRGFYDKILPAVANKLGKKFGAKVGFSRIPSDAERKARRAQDRYDDGDIDYPALEAANQRAREEQDGRPVHSLPITDAMRDAAMGEGFAAFSTRRRMRDPNAAFDPPGSPSRIRKFLTSASFGHVGSAFPSERDIRFNLQDRMIDMREFQKAIEEQSGGPLPGDYDVYQAEELYHGRTGARLFRLRQDFIKPLTRDMRAKKITLTELGEFLMARHAPERNADLQTRGSTLAAPSGMSDVEARRIITGHRTSGRLADFNALASQVDEMVARTRDTLFNAGLISQEQHTDWSTRYQHYVPLRGFENDPESEAEHARLGRGFDVRGPEAKQATGRRSKADNPLVYAIMQAEQAVVRAEKNKVLNTLRRLVDSFPNKAVWEVNRVEERKRINKSTGMIETYYVGPANLFADNVFVAKREGKSTFITIHDPKLARDMKMLGADGLRSFLRLTAWVNRALSKLHTSLNPAFTIPNFFRDATTGLLHLSEHTKRAPGLRRKVLRDIPRAMGAMGRYLAGKDRGTWTRYAREFAEEGGKVEFFNIDSVGEQRRKIEADLKAGRVRQAFRMLGEGIELANGSVENAIRLSTYVNLRRAGYSRGDAASAARNLTVNFNRKGAWGPAINSLYLFYNAAIQGNVRMAQALKRSKVVRRAVIAMILTGAAQDILNYLVSDDDDDDGINRWDKLPAWEKERNYVVWLPGQDGAIKIPLPYGYNVAPVIGTQVSAMVRGMLGMGRGVEPMEAALNIASALTGSFMPISAGSSISQTVSPTISDPFVEIIQNQDWSGRPIHPTNFDPKSDPDAFLHTRGASPIARRIAQAFNAISGGNEFKPGELDYSPDDIDHLVEFFTGGAGDFWYDKIGTNLWRLATGEEIESYQIPFVSKVWTEVGSYTDQNIYYDLAERVELVDNQINGFGKAGNRDEADRIAKAYPVEESVIDAFKASDKALKQLRKALRTVEARTDLSPDRMTAEKNRIRQEMDSVMAEARKAWESARKKQFTRQTSP